MEPEDLKRKISEEMDSSAEHELSEQVKDEIESNEELKKFADDLVTIENILGNVNKQTTKDIDPVPLKDKIGMAVKEAKQNDEDSEEYLSEPMPETEEESAPPRKSSFTYPIVSSKDMETGKEEKDEVDFGRLTSRKMKAGAAQKDSSGLINIGELVQEHRESIVLATPGEKAPTAPAEAPSGKKYAMYVMIVIFAVVGIGAIIQIARMSKNADKGDLETAAVDQESLENDLKAQLVAAMEKEKLEETPSMIQEEQGEKEEAEEVPAATTSEKTVHKTKHKTKKKSASAVAGNTSTAATTQKSENKSDTGPLPKEKSQKDLMSLLDSATAKKGKSPGAESKTGSSKSDMPSVDELMGENKQGQKKEDPSTANLPATLNKNQIRSVMKKLNPKIMKCGEGKVGTLILNLIVNNDGSVKSAKASGQFANNPTGKCAEKIAMKAKFPSFKNQTMNVTYPYVFTPPPGT